MNATPDHDVMRELDDAGYRDAGEVSNEGWQPTWPANHVGILPLLPPLVRIDHVLIGDSMASLGHAHRRHRRHRPPGPRRDGGCS